MKNPPVPVDVIDADEVAKGDAVVPALYTTDPAGTPGVVEYQLKPLYCHINWLAPVPCNANCMTCAEGPAFCPLSWTSPALIDQTPPSSSVKRSPAPVVVITFEAPV